MSAPLSEQQLAEIRDVDPGDWYAGPWTVEYVETNGDDFAHYVVKEPDGQIVASLPDWAGPLAHFIAEARTAMPALVAEVERLRAALSEATDTVAERDSEIGGWSARVAKLEAERGQWKATAERLAGDAGLIPKTTPAPARTAIFPNGKAAFLAKKLSEERAVVSATAVDSTTVDLHVRPASLDEWEFWQRRFHVEPGKATHRGSFATATGTFGTGLRVLLTGLGVGSLYAAERDRNGGAS